MKQDITTPFCTKIQWTKATYIAILESSGQGRVVQNKC